MIGEYEIFPFHNADSAIEILKKELPIDRFSQRYILWTLQEHKELSKRFKFLDNKMREIKNTIKKFDTYEAGGEMWDAPYYCEWLEEIQKILEKSEFKENGDK